MDAKNRKKLWEAARKNGWSADAVAREIGCTGKAVQSVVARGYESGKVAPALDAWLEKNSNRLAVEAAEPVVLESPRMLLARDLRNLADVLSHPDYSDEFVARKFDSWVRLCHGDLGALTKAINKITDN